MADGLFNPSDIYNALAKYNVMPTLINAWPNGAYGAGLFAQYPNVIVTKDPSKATIASAKDDRTDALAHEMTHAAQFNLLEPALDQITNKQKSKEPLTKEESRFAQAMNKLLKADPDFIKKMYKPTTDAGDDSYRTKPSELIAWGTGYMSRPTNPMNKEKPNINPHLNPSMATDFSILMDLFSRLPEDTKNKGITERQKEITEERRYDGGGFFKESSSIFSDPFAPTIK